MAVGKESKIKGDNKVLISDTLLCLDRYSDLLLEMMPEYNVVSYLKTGDCWRSNKYLKGMDAKRWETRSIYVGDSVPEKGVEECVREIRLFFDYLKDNGNVCLDFRDEAERLFSKLLYETNKRVLFLIRKFKKHQIKQFITINQYNLRDVITIMACRKIGIISKELSHYSYCITPIDHNLNTSEFYKDKFFYTNECYVWNEAEKQWYENYVKIYNNIFGDRIRIIVSGCPEITYKHFKYIASKKDKKNSIVFFVPSVEYIEGDYYNSMEIRRLYFGEILKLSKRLGCKVYVRYHPSEPNDNIKMEANIISKYGFEVCTNDKDRLNECLCESVIAITCKSSVASIAHIFGCKVYNIVFNEEQYDYMGIDIENVKLNEISYIDYPMQNKFYPEECINAKLLINPV